MSYAPQFSGSTATVPSSGTATDYTNSSGSTITTATPVSSNTSGQIAPTDVSSEASVLSWVGLASTNISNTALGQVASDGRITNIPSGLGFATGDPIWIGVGGTLTNIKPDLTASGWHTGYWVCFVGVVVKNQFNGSQQDIQLLRQVIGQL
jgi:hypothetical protein